MQANTLDGCEIETPYLVSFSSVGTPPERTALDSLPCTIGRVETAGLFIQSERVSREHAVITEEKRGFRVRDLGSTNGTLVNGQPIEEAALQNGDVLTVADADFIFVWADEQQACTLATQVMTVPARFGSLDRSGRDQVIGLRRMRETLLHQAFDVTLRPIKYLGTNDLFGYSASAHLNGVALEFPGNVDLSLRGRMTVRFRQLIRAMSLDQFVTLDEGGYLFLEVGPAELDHGPELQSHLACLASRIPSSVSLVIQLPAVAADDMSRHDELGDSLNELGIELAYGDAVINRKQLLSFGQTRPSFVVVSPKMISDLPRHRSQQRQLSKLLATCAEIGCQAIANGVSSPEHERCCQELGFQYGLAASL